VLLALAATLLPPSGTPARQAGTGSPRLELGPGPDVSGFARATEPRRFVLPRDHGPHIEYQTEWWYYTGNLVAADGRRFGFQLTFFRRAFAPGPVAADVGGLASHQVYFAHFAITDVAAGRHHAAERFSRGAGGLAGATGEPFAAWLEDWRADSLNADGSAVRLVARDAASGLDLDLELRSKKPLVAHATAASPRRATSRQRFVLRRLHADGRGRTHRRGRSDRRGLVRPRVEHERPRPRGGRLDWFSLQLDDGRELMLFQIRREDARSSPSRAARSSSLTAAPAALEQRRPPRRPRPLDESGEPRPLPSRWRLAVPRERLDLRVEPWLDDQEMRTSFVYWRARSASNPPVPRTLPARATSS